MIIGGDDTPAPPASDLWSSDVRFTLTKSVCKTSEFGDSTAGCHGDEVSWEMQVGKQARPDDYVAWKSYLGHKVISESSASKEADRVVTVLVVHHYIRYCPVGGGRINKHPPHIKTPVIGYGPCKCRFGMMLAGVFFSIQKHLWGCAYGERADYTSLFWETFRYRISRKDSHVICQKNFSPQANIFQTPSTI